jgi:arsenate reductase (thioredoxin)
VAEAVATYGLTHLALNVPDVDRAFAFYEAVFGMVAVYRKDDFIQAQTPGSRDVVVFQRGSRGEPFLYARDRDGYLLEIWYELPTPLDPPMTSPGRPSVVFVCEHGSAKSVIAAAHFQRMADAAGLDVRAISRGTDPDPTFPPNAINGLARDGLRPLDDAPTRLSPEDLSGAMTVVSFCTLPDIYSYCGPLERWEGIPAVSDDYDTARRAIVQRIETLVEQLGSPA